MRTKDRGSPGQPQRSRSVANATLFAVAAPALIVVVAGSALVATYVSAYMSGLVLGVGLIGLAWGVSYVYRRVNACRPRPTGRSLTQDCRQARRLGPALPFEAPRPPTAAQRRARPCPGSHRH